VRAAAVVLRDDAPGEPRLVGYVVLEGTRLDGAGLDGANRDAAALCAGLREKLAEVLPEIMVPSQIVVLEAMPRSPAGKLDRKALPAPEARRAGAWEPPRDELERRLAVLWQEVLAVPAVGIHDGFFELGGHSLSATRLASRIRDELSVELPLRVLFEATTIAELADALRAGGHGAISDDAVDAMADLLDALEDS
jgi:acyl carrier protein